MDWHIPDDERLYLRSLAFQQAEIAHLPVMDERRQMWYALNDGYANFTPPVIVETWTFDRDFLPGSLLRCTTPTAQEVERNLLRSIRNHQFINDDKVIPDTYDIGWFLDIDEFGVFIPLETIQDAQGIETGYRWQHPIKNLERDFEKLKPAACRVDREKTYAWQSYLNDLFGDLLPVHIHSYGSVVTMLTNRVIELMGMEAFFTAMYDSPEALHQLMAYLRDNALRIFHWMEAENLLRLNNGNQDSFGSSYNFTHRLPPPDYQEDQVRLKDLWGATNSQETVGVSPRLFHEFCFPYYRDVCQPWGQIYYGCCEPAHPFWNDISQLPHLKKVSISRWCSEQFMGEALRGTEIVFSRKPDPNFLSVDEKLDEAAWAAHIRATLQATRSVFVEFIIRDVYTVHGNLNNPRRAVEIARQEIEKHY